MSTPGDELRAKLSAPFEEHEVEFKPQVIKGNKALVIAYVDARVIQDRLDGVLGTGNWQDEFEFLPDGNCLCRLKVRMGGEWLTKVDVGSESDQKDVGDRRKSAVSDALKRAAVKFGVGRYLYRLPQFWVDYDPQRKTFKPPQLPGWALPQGKPGARQAAPKPGNDASHRVRQLLLQVHHKLMRANARISDPHKKKTLWAALDYAARKAGVALDLGPPEEWLEPQAPEDLEPLVPRVPATVLGLVLEALTAKPKKAS